MLKLRLPALPHVRLTPDVLYVMLDWTTSALGFLFMALVYRMSPDGAELGGNAALLGLVNTSFFISAALQYYRMLRGAGAREAFLAFAPLLLAELLALYALLPAGPWAIASLIVVLNQMIALYRGELLQVGKLRLLAVLSLFEQLVRIAAFALLLTWTELSVGEAMLASLAVLFVLELPLVAWIRRRAAGSRPQAEAIRPGWMQGWREAFRFRAEPLQYALLYLAVYGFVSADLLISSASPALQAEFARMKPWGLALYTLTVPIINVYLARLQRGESIRPLIRWSVLLYGAYLSAVMIGGRWLNPLLFRKEMPPLPAVALLLLEHAAIALLASIFYTRLHLRRGGWRLVALAGAMTAAMAALPHLLEGTACYAAIAGLFTAGCLLARKESNSR